MKLFRRQYLNFTGVAAAVLLLAAVAQTALLDQRESDVALKDLQLCLGGKFCRS